MTAEFYKLILVTHRQTHPLTEYLAFIEKCVSAGVTCVQLREKNATPSFLLEYAFKLKILLDQYQIPLIINDDLELALKINADGVHLGQSDGSPRLARECLGANKWIGLSIESEVDLQQANQCQVDYVAASAVFPTEHKNNVRTIWGLEGVQSLSRHSLHPLIAIGGISQQNVQEVIAAGAKGVAVIGALHDTEDPAFAAYQLRKLIDRSENVKPASRIK